MEAILWPVCQGNKNIYTSNCLSDKKPFEADIQFNIETTEAESKITLSHINQLHATN